MKEGIFDQDKLELEQAQAGNETVLFKLWQKYEPGIFRFIRLSIPAKFNDTDIENIINNVITKLTTNLLKFKRQSTFKTFIYTITKNETYSFLRKHRQDPEIVSLKQADKLLFQSGPEEKTSKTLLVQRMLNELSPNHREVLIYRFYEEMTFEEIGKIMRKSKESVKKLTQRAIKELGKIYRQQESKVNLILKGKKK